MTTFIHTLVSATLTPTGNSSTFTNASVTFLLLCHQELQDQMFNTKALQDYDQPVQVWQVPGLLHADDQGSMKKWKAGAVQTSHAE